MLSSADRAAIFGWCGCEPTACRPAFRQSARPHLVRLMAAELVSLQQIIRIQTWDSLLVQTGDACEWGVATASGANRRGASWMAVNLSVRLRWRAARRWRFRSLHRAPACVTIALLVSLHGRHCRLHQAVLLAVNWLLPQLRYCASLTQSSLISLAIAGAHSHSAALCRSQAALRRQHTCRSQAALGR